MKPPDETIRMDGGTAAARSHAALRSGDVLSDRYEIRRLLGRGGMGAVFEAYDRELGVSIALKALAPNILADEKTLGRLKKEVLLARQVTHENVCRLHDLGRDTARDLLFCTMELLRGETLAQRLERGILSPEEALPLARQMASALDAAHRAGIVHSDIKTSNVMLVESGQAILTDFGIAQPLAAESPTADTTAAIRGTPAYMAPEQLTGGPVGPAADIYSFGVVLHEMVTGERPFAGPHPREGARGKQNAEPSPLATGPSELPGIWERTVLRCLEREPQNRFESAGLVIAALESREEMTTAETVTQGRLPREWDDFLGRRNELQELESLFERGTRLVSILGMGGAGKTRLALQFARLLGAGWPGGVWFCDLSDARSLEGIASVVAQALGVPLGKEDPVVQLGHAMSGRGKCLIILDNYEQVAHLAGQTLGRWLEHCEDAQFLATSRELLGLAGEQPFELSSLAAADAEALFISRAGAVTRGFAPSEEDREAITDLVALLEFLPLAVEIAAARVAVLTPVQILERAGDRFRLLAASGEQRNKRATLRATLDWSWDLLNDEEQAALAQLSVFEGGFTIDAAEAVLELADLWQVDAIQSLVRKSLVRPGAENRFHLLLTVKEYAAERLDERSEREATTARHGRYFAQFGTDESIDGLDTHGGVDRRQRLGLELDNLAAACRRAAERGDGSVAASACAAAWEVLQLHGPVQAAIGLCAEVLAIGDLTDRDRARCLCSLSWGMRLLGRKDEVLEPAMESLRLARQSGDRRLEGVLLTNLGTMHLDAGQASDARERYLSAMKIHEEVGNRRHEGATLANLAILDWGDGRIEEAEDCFRRALEIIREVGHRRFEGSLLGNMGLFCQQLGRYEEVHRYYEEALGIFREVGDRRSEGIVLGNLGILHRQEGHMEAAERHYEEAMTIHRDVGNRIYEGNVQGNLAGLFARTGRLEAARENIERALEIYREVGSRRFEGVSLGELAYIRMKQGDVEEARERLNEGEALLRNLGDTLGLAGLLCSRGQLDLITKGHQEAAAALSEAETLAGTAGATPESDLGRAILELREAIKEGVYKK